MVFLILGLVAISAQASEAHSEAGGIPTKTIMYQLINMMILIVALVYWTKDKVILYFEGRQRDYNEAFKRTKLAREDAERNLEAVKSKLLELNENKGDSILKAQLDSENEKEQLIKEAQSKAKRLKSETLNAISNEIEKAKASVRRQILDEGMRQAKVILIKNIGAQEHQTLQNEFSGHVKDVTNENARNL